MKLQTGGSMKIVFLLVAAIGFFYAGDVKAVLPLKKAAPFATVISDSGGVNKDEVERERTIAVARHHLSFFRDVKLTKVLHKFRPRGARSTHYGRLSFCLALGAYGTLISGFALASAIGGFLAFLLFGGVTILAAVGAIIFGARGIKHDRHRGLSIAGLVLGIASAALALLFAFIVLLIVLFF